MFYKVVGWFNFIAANDSYGPGVVSGVCVFVFSSFPLGPIRFLTK